MTKHASVWPLCALNDASAGTDRESIRRGTPFPRSPNGLLAHASCPAAPDQGVYPLNPVSAAATTCQGVARHALMCPDTWPSSPTVMARFG